MTPHDDDVVEMGTPLLDDEAIEAFFLGTSPSGWAHDAALVTLAEEVALATGGPPPRPHGALLAFLGEVAPAAGAAPTLVSVPTAAPSPSPSSASPWQPRTATGPTTPVDPSSNVRHLVSRRLRLTAGIAAGIAMAAAALTVAGTTGVLPDPAMQAIARVVEAVTPFELSEPTKPPAPTVTVPQPGAPSTVPATPGEAPGAAGLTGPTEQPVVTSPAGPPASVPTGAEGPGQGQGPAQPGSTGLDRAGQTPAGSFIPPFVTDGPPAPPSAANGDGSGPPTTGVDRARDTPAGTVIPPFAGGPPGRR